MVYIFCKKEYIPINNLQGGSEAIFSLSGKKLEVRRKLSKNIAKAKDKDWTPGHVIGACDYFGMKEVQKGGDITTNHSLSSDRESQRSEGSSIRESNWQSTQRHQQ
jgi:hypothetical protein